MIETTERQTAKIYHLSDTRAKRAGSAKQFVGMRPSGAVPEVLRTYFGDAWYHDAAIAEEARLHKR